MFPKQVEESLLNKTNFIVNVKYFSGNSNINLFANHPCLLSHPRSRLRLLNFTKKGSSPYSLTQNILHSRFSVELEKICIYNSF